MLQLSFRPLQSDLVSNSRSIQDRERRIHSPRRYLPESVHTPACGSKSQAWIAREPNGFYWLGSLSFPCGACEWYYPAFKGFVSMLMTARFAVPVEERFD